MSPMFSCWRTGAALAGAFCLACSSGPGTAGSRPGARPSILLVTLDTTRADAMGPDARGVSTPRFNTLAAAGIRFRQAYTTVPETLPAHASIMTGLYPAGHGVHENARFVPEAHPVVAERLRAAGYRTSAFVSAFVLARRFGLARGFDVYDDELSGAERPARATTDRAIADLRVPTVQPRFVWVHYFDAHAPYEPEEPFRQEYATNPYLGEIAAVDRALGRLLDAFESLPGPRAVIVVGDHGEGLGDHGESQHGHLLYQSTTHVPLAMAGPGADVRVEDKPVSIRRVFHTILDWAGLDSTQSLRRAIEANDVVLGEAMKPFLEYGWQPQVMAVAGSRKAILTGTLELYDLSRDPSESTNLAPAEALPSDVRRTLEEYPIPGPESAQAGEALDAAAREKLASLGYVGATSAPVVRTDAPRPVDMVAVLDLLERASGLFVRQRYADVIPVLQQILKLDPRNLDATLRLASAHSALGQNRDAEAAFARAGQIAPRSPDVRLYLALHYARGRDWPRAVPLLEATLADAPERLPALEALASIRERQGRVTDALALIERVDALRAPTPAESVRLGRLAMAAGQTATAIAAFERARGAEGALFAHDLELGVLYLADRRFPEARDALDRVPASHAEYPMVLFKRAQVSVLLGEPDASRRIALARERADRTTRPLIARERLFQGRDEP